MMNGNRIHRLYQRGGGGRGEGSRVGEGESQTEMTMYCYYRPSAVMENGFSKSFNRFG